jgi:hypothetical protein
MSTEACMVPDSQSTTPIGNSESGGSAFAWRGWWASVWQSIARLRLTAVHGPEEWQATHHNGTPQATRLLLVEAGQLIIADGNIIRGAACVDESVITGQSAPVIREAGRASKVIRGTRVVSGQILVEVAQPRANSRQPAASSRSGKPHADANAPTSSRVLCATSESRQ